MKVWVSRFIVSIVKIFSQVFYRTEVSWVANPGEKPFEHLRMFIFLNHTSLYEPLFLSAFPWSYVWDATRRTVIPGADKTLNRPLVGMFFHLLAPKMISITRKRDESWSHFLQQIGLDSLVTILPEGRMHRRDGLDAQGKPMSIRGGVADILKAIDSGKLLIAYSGGLHHVQFPGELLPRVFKKISIRFELLHIEDYKKKWQDLPYEEYKKAVIEDLTLRLKQNVP